MRSDDAFFLTQLRERDPASRRDCDTASLPLDQPSLQQPGLDHFGNRRPRLGGNLPQPAQFGKADGFQHGARSVGSIQIRAGIHLVRVTSITSFARPVIVMATVPA